MTSAEPTFSVIINTTDRAGPLQTLLRSLEHQSYPHFEVIVVVGPTRDNTREILAPFGSRVQVLECPTANLSRSRNIGLLAARGEVVAYTDDDAVPARRWLEQMARLFRDPHVDGTGGVVHQIHPSMPGIQHRMGIASSLAEQHNVRDSLLDQIVPAGRGRQWITRMMGANMAFRRTALLDVGGFDEFFIYIAEETDLALRMVNQGYLIHPVREAPVYHVPASSRNRVVFSARGRWWLGTRAFVYYALKNGPASGETPGARVLQGLHRLYGQWLWYGRLRRSGQITRFQALRSSAEEVWGAMDGAAHGLFSPRRILPPEVTASARDAQEPIRPFLVPASPEQPVVDPVSGAQPRITLPDEPLRICLTSGLYPPDHFDGIGRHTNLMARGLFACGHAVHVVTRGEREQVSFYDGAYVHRIPYRLERYPHYRHLPGLHHTLNYSHAVHEKVVRLLMNDGIQVVDSALWQVNGLVTAVSDLLPVVVRLQTSMRQVSAIQRDWDEDKRLMGDMEQCLLDRAAHLVPNSRATLEAVGRSFRLTEQLPSTVVPHGIEPVADAAIRPFPLDGTPRELTVLYVGRLEKRKGIEALMEAMPRVLAKVPGAHFTIVGEDNSLHDGFRGRTGEDYATHFRRRFPGAAARVRFRGLVDDEELQRLYQSCDLFVAPSLYESFGLIYLEAMNYAKPVVGCRAGGIPEVVDDGVSGVLVEPDASRPLAEAMVDLLSSPRRLHEMGLAGRQRLLDRFTHVLMARSFAAIYRAVVNRRVGQAGDGGTER